MPATFFLGERVTGKVKWFNMKRGFGFIETEGNGDLFVHHTQIRAEGFKALNEGAEVELTLSTGDKGMPSHACTCMPIKFKFQETVHST